jgi:hypothetical protein
MRQTSTYVSLLVVCLGGVVTCHVVSSPRGKDNDKTKTMARDKVKCDMIVFLVSLCCDVLSFLSCVDSLVFDISYACRVLRLSSCLATNTSMSLRFSLGVGLSVINIVALGLSLGVGLCLPFGRSDLSICSRHHRLTLLPPRVVVCLAVSCPFLFCVVLWFVATCVCLPAMREARERKKKRESHTKASLETLPPSLPSTCREDSPTLYGVDLKVFVVFLSFISCFRLLCRCHCFLFCIRNCHSYKPARFCVVLVLIMSSCLGLSGSLSLLLYLPRLPIDWAPLSRTAS